MNIFTDIQNLPQIKNLVLTIGSFDGVHKGHKELLQAIQQKADEKHGQSGLVTFHPHPRLVLQPNKKQTIRLLNTLEEKLELLKSTGLQNVFVVPFSVDFANLSAQEYLQDFLVAKFHPKCLVIGYDHKFGKGRTGDYQLLEDNASKYGYELEQISQQKLEDITYSSTNIRKLLLTGDIVEANKMLGYEYFIQGIVAHGDKRGREIGYPTANIEINNDYKLIPANGVYAVQTEVEGKIYNGMLNIGTRPTFNGEKKQIENHLFDFSESIYGHHIKIKFIGRLRNEKRFNSVLDLQTQLTDDKKRAIALLQ